MHLNVNQKRPRQERMRKKRYRLFTTEVIYVLAAAPKAVDYFLLWQTWGWFVEVRIKLIYSEPLTSGGKHCISALTGKSHLCEAGSGTSRVHLSGRWQNPGLHFRSVRGRRKSWFNTEFLISSFTLSLFLEQNCRYYIIRPLRMSSQAIKKQMSGSLGKSQQALVHAVCLLRWTRRSHTSSRRALTSRVLHFCTAQHN